MLKKKQYDLDIRDVTPVIEEAIRRLPNGELRLSLSRFPLSHVCRGGFNAPDFSERISSNYSMPSINDGIAEQFYEEIALIEEIMKEMHILDKPDSLSLSCRACAMQIWDYYAIPWRFHNETIHLIWSPHDLMGTPIIHSYPVSYFLRALTEILEKQYEQAWRQARHLKYWKIFMILIFIIAGVVLWMSEAL